MTTGERLTALLENGNLTVADLSLLLSTPYATVRGWVNGGEVGGAPLDAAYVMGHIKALETRLRRDQGLPVPRLTQQARSIFINKLKETIDA